jgi:glycosyltransferase involved in cell wall biosynthesis
MPWDALICTSAAVARTVTALLESESDYLRWRFGASLDFTLPQLPVIQLGVHPGDFDFGAGDRAAARRALNIAEDEVVALFVGRLSFHAKAHPYPMYVGLERAARRSGKKIVLIQCGWFGHRDVDAAFRAAAAQFAPDIRAVFTDGRERGPRRDSWAAADIFISLADNFQETFGLSPIEAMAARLPVVVTDWDGYRDTVRDGIDGFRIPTWAPAPGNGADFASRYESRSINYDMYCALTSATVSLDMDMLADRLTTLVVEDDLRRGMGEAGRRRAQELFDWNVVYRQYQALWAELAAIRKQAAAHFGGPQYLRLAPKSAAARSDPYVAFAHYSSATILPTTLVVASSQGGPSYHDLVKQPLFHLAAHPIFGYSNARQLLGAAMIDDILRMTRAQPQTVRQLADRLGVDVAVALRGLASLAKMGFVQFRNPTSPMS